MDDHILLGAWLQEPRNAAEVRLDAAMGENIYWNLAGRPGVDHADYNVIRANGMHASAPDTSAATGSETVAFDGFDEGDMDFGPGSNGWQNNGTYSESACVPTGSQCGFTEANFFYTGQPSSDGSPGYPVNGTPIHQGYGKGVLFWYTDAQAARFLKYSDILSADSYWLTDDDLSQASQGGCALLPDSPTACNGGGGPGLSPAQTKLPANYAYNVTQLERLQALNGPSKPVVVPVETGCPFSGGSSGGNCATPAQTVAAAWQALIAGARGIIWFQHNFSGPCQDDRTFSDGSEPSSGNYNCQQTPGVTLHDVVLAVTAFDKEVTSLNSALLSPTVIGYVSSSGDVSTMVKAYGGSCYLFAGSGRPATPPPYNQSVTMTLADNYTGPVSVIEENRTVQAVNGSFQDTFADADSVHIYRITGATCATSQTGSAPARVLAVTPKSFRVAARSSKAPTRSHGATIIYTALAAARVTFTADRKLGGDRVGRRCVAARRPARKHVQHCTRLVGIRASFGHEVHAGVNHFYFAGWIGKDKLSPGSYQLNARGSAPELRCTFRIIG
jgi:hypothetical protein